MEERENEEQKEFRELMVTSNGNLKFAIELKSGKNFFTMVKGKPYFTDHMYSKTAFIFGDESHRIAKTIFVDALRMYVRKRVMELKQLEAVLTEIGYEDCIGNSMEIANKILGSENLALSGTSQVITEEKVYKRNGDDIYETSKSNTAKIKTMIKKNFLTGE